MLAESERTVTCCGKQLAVDTIKVSALAGAGIGRGPLGCALAQPQRAQKHPEFASCAGFEMAERWIEQ
eukprot:13188307-Alexandrium_andersonii.AAC.1